MTETQWLASAVRYLDEQAFRFNEREGNDADRFVRTMKQIEGRRIQYQQLIGEQPIN